MTIWHSRPTLEALADESRDTMMAHLGIEYLEVGDDYLRGRMPVDDRTLQPMGLLHGGASAALAETLGSLAANYCLDRKHQRALGLEINANHIRGAQGGWVIGTARPLHLGRSTQVWEIRIENDAGALTCIARLTMTVVSRRR